MDKQLKKILDFEEAITSVFDCKQKIALAVLDIVRQTSNEVKKAQR